MNTISRTSRQEVLALIVRRGHLVAGCGVGFVDGDLDRGEFGGRHAGEVEEVEGGIYEGYVEVCGRWNGRGVG